MEGDTRQDTTGQRRLSVQDAAAEMGATVDAIRKRVQRRTIPHEKDDEGRVWVLLGPLDADRTGPDTGETTAGQGQDADEARAELRDELRARIRFLEGQLETEQRAHGETRRIVAGLVQRIPELEAPREATEARESPDPTQQHPTPAPEEAQEPAEPPGDRTNRLQQELLETRRLLEDERSRPWWRRVFGR